MRLHARHAAALAAALALAPAPVASAAKPPSPATASIAYFSYSPVFSPDGTRLAWVRGNEDRWAEITVARLATPTVWTVVGNEKSVRYKGSLDW